MREGEEKHREGAATETRGTNGEKTKGKCVGIGMVERNNGGRRKERKRMQKGLEEEGKERERERETDGSGLLDHEG